MNRLWTGCKLGIALVLGLPFIVVLVPLWFVYRWSERREGRPAPEAPWNGMGRRAVAERAPFVPPLEDGARAVAERAPFVPPLEDGRGGAGRVALVTGGGKRLGRAICQDLASLGYTVGVVYHQDREAAEDCVAAIRRAGGQACALALDLTDPDGMEVFLREAESRLGGEPELLVNNAGLFLPTELDHPSWESMSAVLRVNLQGPLWLALRVGQRMRAHRGGGIIHVGDIWGERPLRGYAAYSAAKAGLLMATRALARELGPEVRVNAIAPGAVLPPEG
ncbi:MAG: SDR family NAD(P)-dependent oxidoreductase, partial [Magnetococcales bacterium]|nr:SDR family NAD(P)-dependent oxidoreductase [Magnetococcales bacterium]